MTIPLIVDADGIKLYRDDLVEDEYGEIWILSELSGLFLFRHHDSDRCIPVRCSDQFQLKWHKTKY